MSKGKQHKTITFLWGLPGCGKTTYSEQNIDYHSRVVDVDSIFLQNSKSIQDSIKALSKVLVETLSCYNVVILDGLFTTNAQVRKLIDYLSITFSEYDLIFKIVCWREDRETCLFNDAGRRELSSSISIQNIPFELPDVSILPECAKSKRITYQKTVRKSPAALMAIRAGLDENTVKTLKFKSSEWCMGGSWGNCYGDGGDIAAEEQPEFDAFDSLLEQICPQITFLQYKKIKKECCTVETRGDSDYYGGHSSYGFYLCDLEKLYSILNELNLLPDK
jgi:hypothetical protein